MKELASSVREAAAGAAAGGGGDGGQFQSVMQMYQLQLMEKVCSVCFCSRLLLTLCVTVIR